MIPASAFADSFTVVANQYSGYVTHFSTKYMIRCEEEGWEPSEVAKSQQTYQIKTSEININKSRKDDLQYHFTLAQNYKWNKNISLQKLTEVFRDNCQT